jgi:hypothetical protein
MAMADGSIVLVEIRARTLTRIDPHGRREVIAELGGGPNSAAIGPDGAAYVANNGDAWGWAAGDTNMPAARGLQRRLHARRPAHRPLQHVVRQLRASSSTPQ